MQKPVVVIGAGGHAKVVLDLCEKARIRVRGVVDSRLTSQASFCGSAVLGDDRVLDESALLRDSTFVIAIGDGQIRRDLAKRITSRGGTLATLIHPSAVIGVRTSIGPGTVVFASAVVNCDSRIGSSAIVNTGAQIDHDCTIGDGVHICPGAVLAGTVTVGEWTVVGPGAVIAKNRAVGAYCTIGAGSVVVVKDVPDRSLACGNPCRVQASASFKTGSPKAGAR